ncbi:hypothetical protein A3Q56_08761, partial [Intoshia linei]
SQIASSVGTSQPNVNKIKKKLGFKTRTKKAALKYTEKQVAMVAQRLVLFKNLLRNHKDACVIIDDESYIIADLKQQRDLLERNDSEASHSFYQETCLTVHILA